MNSEKRYFNKEYKSITQIAGTLVFGIILSNTDMAAVSAIQNVYFLIYNYKVLGHCSPIEI